MSSLGPSKPKELVALNQKQTKENCISLKLPSHCMQGHNTCFSAYPTPCPNAHRTNFYAKREHVVFFKKH